MPGGEGPWMRVPSQSSRTLLIGPRRVNDGLRRGDAVEVARESRELGEWDPGKSGERGSHWTELIRVVDAVYSGG
jgi:hypothetical protein